MSGPAATSNDSAELEALFDSISAASKPDAANDPNGAQPAERTAGSALDCPPEEIINRIGQMTRKLHDSLRELGFDKALGEAASAIPDARERLAYVATLTERAAERVLNATEIAKPIQCEIESAAAGLSARWKKAFAQELTVQDFQQLSLETSGFLDDVQLKARATDEKLTEIMMAQDFQDLTGQVIKKVTALAQSMEQELLKVLIDSAPTAIRVDKCNAGLEGPIVCAAGRTDVVSSQAQVDEMLESLGF